MNSHELLGCVCVCMGVTNHSIKKHLLKYKHNWIKKKYIYIYKRTCKFQHFNCMIAVFLLVLLSSYPHPTRHFFNKCCHVQHAVEPTFFTTVHSFQGGSKHEKTHTIVYKGSFFTNIIPKYQLCFRNTTFFTKVLLCFLCRH